MEQTQTTQDSELNVLFASYVILQKGKDALEEQLDKVDEKLNPLKQKIIDLMVALDFQSIVHDGIKYHLSVPARPSIVPEKRSQFMVLLAEWGETGIVQTDYVNSNTLYGWYGQLPEDKKELLTTSGYLKVSEDIILKSPKAYSRKRAKR